MINSHRTCPPHDIRCFFTGGPDDFVADREVAGFMSGNHNDSSLMLAGSLVGGAGNRVGGGGAGGGSGVLGGSGEGGHAPLRRPRVSPTTSLFMRGRSPSAARSESKTGANSLPRYSIDIYTKYSRARSRGPRKARSSILQWKACKPCIVNMAKFKKLPRSHFAG